MSINMTIILSTLVPQKTATAGSNGPGRADAKLRFSFGDRARRGPVWTRLDAGRQSRVDPPLELLFRHVADDPLDQLAAAEDPQRRDAHDAVARCDRAVLVHVQLAHAQLTLVLAGQVLDDRGDHLARSAPRRPEVHEDRDLRLQYIRVEVLFGDCLSLARH